MKKFSIADAFSRVAIWQVMTFVMLTCFVWVLELFDLTAIVFGVEPTPPSFFRASLLSAGVIVAGIVAVGHTYEKQKDSVKRIMNACLYCHRVETATGGWEHVEEYFIEHFPIVMERGVCPQCEKMLTDIDKHNTPDKTPLDGMRSRK